MSINHEEDQDDGIAGSTIIMVDTCDDSVKESEDESFQEEFFEVDDTSEKNISDIINNEKEALYCMLCGIQFDFGDEIALAEHMQMHEKNDYEEPTSRRNVTRRKASLGLKRKYKSLIPNYKEDDDLMKDDDNQNEKPNATKHRKTTKNQGRVLLFKNSFTCPQCNKKLASQKALNHHLR